MILTELNGGLGNQLFQYAAGKSLSLYHKEELKLDISYFNQIGKSHELIYFQITDQIASQKEIDSFIKKGISKKVITKLTRPHKRTIYREPYFHFDLNFFDSKSNVYLKGLRQSEKYFLKFEEQIRKILTIKPQYVNHLNEVAKKIKEEDSISIHIRRGDYLTKVALEVLGLVPLEFYIAAINEITLKTEKPKVYFFSDDIDWVKRNFTLPFDYEFASSNIAHNSIEDFYLMSQCKHNIIANSSFSWWSAWLNNNPDKMIIAPLKWFNKGPKDTQDLIPPGWITI
jgi:hypothetical protein